MHLRKHINLFIGRIKRFFKEENGGSFIEYALLLGFGLFLFIIIFGVVSNIMDWVLGMKDGLFNLFG